MKTWSRVWRILDEKKLAITLFTFNAKWFAGVCIQPHCRLWLAHSYFGFSSLHDATCALWNLWSLFTNIDMPCCGRTKERTLQWMTRKTSERGGGLRRSWCRHSWWCMVEVDRRRRQRRQLGRYSLAQWMWERAAIHRSNLEECSWVTGHSYRMSQADMKKMVQWWGIILVTT